MTLPTSRVTHGDGRSARRAPAAATTGAPPLPIHGDPGRKRIIPGDTTAFPDKRTRGGSPFPAPRRLPDPGRRAARIAHPARTAPPA
ncbi:hypothetical protein EAO69_21935 [Streptomyces sp. me109]|nr:hypothetical protein EAO69_21935 [Streptomyces sp. me109]